MPGDHLPAGLAQRALAERLDHAGLLGDRDELGRRNQAARRIAPAQQRLDAAGPAGLHVDLRLVDEEKLAILSIARRMSVSICRRFCTRAFMSAVKKR